MKKMKLKNIISLKEEFENSFEVDAEAQEEEWHKAEPDHKVNWDKQLSLGNIFGIKSKGKKKKEEKKDGKKNKKEVSISFLVVKDKK